MPIIYVHGVATRNREGFFEIETFLRRLVAPVIADDPENVLIDDVFWGGNAAAFGWNGLSRPRTRLLGQGAQDIPVTSFDRTVGSVGLEHTIKNAPAGAAPPTGGLISGTASAAAALPPVRLRDFSPQELSDVLAIIADGLALKPGQNARLKIAADDLARDANLRAQLTAANSTEQEITILTNQLRQRAAIDAGLVGMGGGGWLDGLRDRLSETLQRSAGLPAYVLSTAAAEIRPKLNDFIAVFLGDVFVYLNNREVGGMPGVIPSLFLEKIKEAVESRARRGNEPIVVLSHSMGGQIVYDAVTYFIGRDPVLRNERIDFWCATASQVGLFEELKLFRSSLAQFHKDAPVPFPNEHLGVWWNVWDYNDFISYTARGIVDKVDDGQFDSGMGLVAAHGGYLKRPSFYRKLAEKLRAAAADGWKV